MKQIAGELVAIVIFLIIVVVNMGGDGNDRNVALVFAGAVLILIFRAYQKLQQDVD